jgi:hypothetical protein
VIQSGVWTRITKNNFNNGSIDGVPLTTSVPGVGTRNDYPPPPYDQFNRGRIMMEGDVVWQTNNGVGIRILALVIEDAASILLNAVPLTGRLANYVINSAADLAITDQILGTNTFQNVALTSRGNSNLGDGDTLTSWVYQNSGVPQTIGATTENTNFVRLMFSKF